MTKSEALRQLGGSPLAAAAILGITPQAIYQWPQQLTPRIEDRVLAALARRGMAAPAEPAKHDA